MTRRDFCKATMAATIMGGMDVSGVGIWNSTPNLRVGVLSDVHVDSDRPAANLERALRHFDRIKVDAVLIAGDLVTNGRRWEFERMVSVWRKVFPDDRRSDGVKVEKLFVTGNHDVDGWCYGQVKTLEAAKECAFYFHRQEWWREFFGEDYRPVSVKEVYGYKFVLRHWLSICGTEGKRGLKIVDGFEDDPDVTGDFLAAQDLRGSKPFFYVQHEPPRDTVNATWLTRGIRWGDDGDVHAATATKMLSDYPNAIALCGHSHFSLTDEMSIWQGAFTAVNCSCLCGYVFTPPGRENGWNCDDFNRTPPFEMERLDIFAVNQGMVMDVYDDRIVFERREFRNGHKLGPDWIVPLGVGAPKPYAFESRMREAIAPSFPEDATATVSEVFGYGRDSGGRERAKEGHAQVRVAFPSARSRNGTSARGWDYAVRCELLAGDIVRTLVERCVFSPNSMMPEEDDNQLVVCAFARTELPKKLNAGQKVRFVITPRTCWGKEGRPISVEWTPNGK